MSTLLPKPLAMDAETVTLSRTAWEAYIEELEDAADRRAIAKHDAWVAEVDPSEARRLSYTDAEVTRALDGASTLTIWRERAGLTQRALAEAAQVSPSYLAEVETGKKPGSAAALLRLAKVLNVPMEMLVSLTG